MPFDVLTVSGTGISQAAHQAVVLGHTAQVQVFNTDRVESRYLAGVPSSRSVRSDSMMVRVMTETAVRRPRGEPGVQPVSGIKRRPHRGNRFWARGYCVDTVGLDEAKIRAYAPALRVDSLLRAAR